MSVGAGRSKGDGVRAQLAINAAKRRDLSTQSTGVDEGHSQKPLARQGQGVGANPAQVTAVAQRHRRHAVCVYQSSSTLNRQASSYSTEATAAIKDRGGAALAKDMRLPLGVECTGEDLIDVLVEPQRSMGIVAKEAGLHQMLGHGSGVREAAAGRLKHGTTDTRQWTWLEAPHYLGHCSQRVFDFPVESIAHIDAIFLQATVALWSRNPRASITIRRQ